MEQGEQPTIADDLVAAMPQAKPWAQVHSAEINQPVMPIDDLGIVGAPTSWKLATDEAIPTVSMMVGRGPDKPHDVRLSAGNSLLTQQSEGIMMSTETIYSQTVANNADSNLTLSPGIYDVTALGLSWFGWGATRQTDGQVNAAFYAGLNALIQFFPFCAPSVFDGNAYVSEGRVELAFAPPLRLVLLGDPVDNAQIFKIQNRAGASLTMSAWLLAIVTQLP